MLTTTRRKLYHTLRPWLTSRKRKFEDIFHHNKWRDPESRSGYASTLAQTERLREEIPKLLKEIDIQTMLDIPCGDLNWIRETDLGEVRYTGADIVPDLIKLNRQNHSDILKTFLVLDIVKDPLPPSDLILCRDCLVHLPFKDIFRAIKNFKQSGSTYLLVTTFIKSRDNRDIQVGNWRPLNLMLPPFNWPDPDRIINEGFYDPHHIYEDKSLGLWKIENL